MKVGDLPIKEYKDFYNLGELQRQIKECGFRNQKTIQLIPGSTFYGLIAG